MKRNRIALVILLLVQTLLGTGCTTALWEKDRFTQYHHPADTADLKFFYSDKRQDVLVEYTEASPNRKTVEHRAYWLDQNRWRINHAWKPHFVSRDAARGLMSVPVATFPIAPGTPGGKDLYAVVSNAGWFTLYSGSEELLSGNLPAYHDRFKQTAARLLLTPAAVTADGVVVGAVAAYYSLPSIVEAASRSQR